MPDGTSIGTPIPVVGGAHFVQSISRYLGETVTIFTTSGGESGSGFTGVLTLVTPEYVRLVTAIGFPPACSLGNGCDFECDSRFDGGFRRGSRFRRRFNFGRFSSLGSVVDIPIARIASFAHSTL